MAAAPVYLHHRSSLEHDTGPHPEQPARIAAIERELELRGWIGYERLSSTPADRDAITAVHPERHVDAIERICARGGGQLDLDTVVSERSFEAALHAAGGAVQLVDLLLAGDASTGFSAHRPPGHHAERNQAMGFCLFNNIAIAARHALSDRGLERVLILDWDVHHGNGTNDTFHSSDQVLFISIHQSPLYPGTGAAGDVGSGAGRGYTVNLPVAPGSGDDEFRSLVEHVVVPLAHAFAPQLVLVSAGYDGHHDDPLANCTLTEAGFAAMAATVRRIGAELQAPVGAVLEGGYHLGALARSVAATLEALRGPAGAGDELAISPLALRARERLAEWWPALR